MEWEIPVGVNRVTVSRAHVVNVGHINLGHKGKKL